MITRLDIINFTRLCILDYVISDKCIDVQSALFEEYRLCGRENIIKLLNVIEDFIVKGCPIKYIKEYVLVGNDIKVVETVEVDVGKNIRIFMRIDEKGVKHVKIYTSELRHFLRTVLGVVK